MSNIIPTLRYQDAPAAIEWLCNTFGFEKHLVVPGEGNLIMHAQLKLGSGMIMLGSQRPDEYGHLLKTPAETNGHNTQAPYIVIPNIEAHYAQAQQAGAEITKELETQDYGGKLYSCKDLEGHLWNFGSYDPWGE